MCFPGVSSAIDGVGVGGTLESHQVGEKDDFRTLAAGSKSCRKAVIEGVQVLFWPLSAIDGIGIVYTRTTWKIKTIL